MTYSSEVLADSPLAYWRLGEASGGTLVDSSGNGAAGTYSGTIAHVTGLISGDTDTCVDFNGTNSSADTPAFTGGADPTRLSVDAVIQLDANNKLQIVHTRANESGTNRKSFRLAVSSANHAVFEAWIGGTLFTATGSTTLSVGTIYHIAGTFDESDVKVYVNGSLDGSSAAAGLLTLYGSGLGGLLGAGYNGSLYGFFDGKIDEVAYYGTALSPTRIAAHAAAVAGAPTGTFTATLPVVSASFAGAYTQPVRTGTFSATLPKITASLTGTYSGTLLGAFESVLPFPTADFAGTYTPPTQTGTFAATLPKITGSFSGGYFSALETGNFAVTLPALGASFTGVYLGPFPTDTSNALDGLDITFTGTATVERPPAPVPAGLVLAEKYDKAIAYPQPVMDNGRPE